MNKKTKAIVGLISLVALFLFSNMMPVSAVMTGIVSYEATVRTVPGTGGGDSTVIGTLSPGQSVIVIDTVPTSDSSNGCSSDLWHKFIYNGVSAYACSTRFDTTNKYNRPWNTPKKAIIGGAIFKAENYISKGQYTSYLFKFNVNPSANNFPYGHQYMTNIRAPYYEAKTSYGIYLENELLDDPLVFSIPIFNGMPDYTYLPAGAQAYITPINGGQSNITDPTFETSLNAQGFPESYKRQLRALHSAFPNWAFEALQTGLNWNEAVSDETSRSYVSSPYQGGSYMILNSTDLGGGWYWANSQAVAYFLDPRNFLTPERVLMFEKLAYSSIYTEAVIQSRLDSTFMKGTSALDNNQTFASIFIDAGKAANISPVYLVSQAIQEIGSNGSIATTGQQFEYKGICYKGLYNFFNVGALDSELSPAKAGLVWASGGASSTIVACDGSSNDSVETGYLNTLGVTKTGGYLTGVELNQTVQSMTAAMTTPNVTISVTNANGTALTGSSKLGTGSKIIINDGTNVYTNTVVIYGDISGDGAINAIDLLYMRKHLLKTLTLSAHNLQAAKIAKGKDVSAVDLLYLRKYLLDSNAYKITQ